MKTSLFILALSTSAISTGAQTSLGPEIGLNQSNLKIVHSDWAFSNHLKTGFRIGLNFTSALDRNWDIQSGLYYYTKGSNVAASHHSDYYASTIEIGALQLPLYFNIHAKTGRYGRAFAGVGTFVDFHVNGKESLGTKDYDLAVGSTVYDDLKQFDGGLGLQAGYQINNGICLRMQYQLGLANITPIPGEKMNSRSFAVSVSYLFRQGAGSKRR